MATFAKEALELIHALQGLRTSSYIDTASFAILGYDYLLTFEDERTLIWPSNWSAGKVLFVLTRYLPFVDLSITASHHFRTGLTPEECSLAYKSAGWLINIGIIIAELILVLRTWAIWEKNRKVTITLGIWASLSLIADVVVMCLFMRSIEFSSLPAGLSGCLVTSGNTLIVGVWIILMVYEAGIIALMVLKVVQMFREFVDKELRNQALYKAVFRNGMSDITHISFSLPDIEGTGAIFYVYIFTMSVANVIVISRLSRDLSTMLASLERITHAILTQRLLLSLRKAVTEPGADEIEKVETMRFGEAPRGATDTETGFGTSVLMSTLSGRYSSDF
ncbi:uncharacterized protein FOMMEDRAFT_161580 [Fomitiporia mediterranea MF3/22]|uniref:uncharacterized protein n=1 Tax=Fomitiporia mediterranea (strain MF3/22) TaxID=694068 RepID=UPI00044077F6|nr:uncharacterized protein FOMMEDRAFT_161580 [Fomitiporia mediterranea MF3/22]EJC98747.1 hypothetical protein FOMMEDRAFT_161580 [Fomitiporia mediterranea MF3/22]